MVAAGFSLRNEEPTMKIVYALVIIFLSALIGTALGELISMLVPQSSFTSTFFSTFIAPSWQVKKLDLIVFAVNFGIQLKINVLSLMGMIIGAVCSLKKL